MSRASRTAWKQTLDRMAERVGRALPAVTELAAERRDPFDVLVSTIISLRTKDEVTGPASRRLLGRAPTIPELAELPEAEIAALIYPAGFYNTKARQLRAVAAILLRDHDGTVPGSLAALLRLPGVGRKTANLVLGLSFDIPAICVDTHVHRICNRLGWVDTRDPDATELALARVMPRRYWIPINAIMVGFGQQVCTPQSPRCSGCPVHGLCARRGVTRRR
ncbi:MAG: endonuclease III [Spirochaetaceae bacterium]|nr:endonuclease III [Spirochaetaceae bacterium]